MELRMMARWRMLKDRSYAINCKEYILSTGPDNLDNAVLQISWDLFKFHELHQQISLFICLFFKGLKLIWENSTTLTLAKDR